MVDLIWRRGSRAVGFEAKSSANWKPSYNSLIKALTDKIDIMLSIYTAHDTQMHLAARLRARREALKHSRAEAAKRSGVPEATIRRFEIKGEISLRQLLMLCEAYGDLGKARNLIPEPFPATMDELIAYARRG